MSTTFSVATLYSRLGLPDAPFVIDVRSDAQVAGDSRLIPGAVRRDVDRIAQWASALPRTRQCVVYGADSSDTSAPAVKALARLGLASSVLEGGLAGWMSAGLVTVRARAELGSPGRSRWITRERPKIDRLACPWLVRRFIDPDAAFFYAPAHRVRSEARTLEAQPYDIADVTFTHRGARCSFDAFIDEFQLHDPAIEQLADIVRAADTGNLDAAREAPGLLAISLGMSATITDDIVLLEQAMPLYDALYAWCKQARSETHSWPGNAGYTT